VIAAEGKKAWDPDSDWIFHVVHSGGYDDLPVREPGTTETVVRRKRLGPSVSVQVEMEHHGMSSQSFVGQVRWRNQDETVRRNRRANLTQSRLGGRF
jgi:hypothetical protein